MFGSMSNIYIITIARYTITKRSRRSALLIIGFGENGNFLTKRFNYRIRSEAHRSCQSNLESVGKVISI